MYHCCKDCAKSLAIPCDRECTRMECGCKDNRKECNRSGGVTSCGVFIKK